MNGYLLDTDVIVFFLRNKRGIRERMARVNPKDLYVSEISVAELEYGNQCSGRYDENHELVGRFLSMVNIIPFSVSIIGMLKKGIAFAARERPLPISTY